MRTALLPLLLLAACSSGAPAQPAPTHAPGMRTAHPVAVELFTSQGCSSCPPADALLERLADDPGVVAIGRAVTYWDGLGWKDTLARPANTELQRAYSSHGLPGSGNYTPEAVIQGRRGAVGSSEGEVRRAIENSGRLPEPGLKIARAAGGSRTVSLSGTPGQPAEVMLVALRRHSDVQIGRGENGGRTLRYANALIGERRIGGWSGGDAALTIPAAALRVAGADRYALIVREGAGGAILAARYL